MSFDFYEYYPEYFYSIRDSLGISNDFLMQSFIDKKNFRFFVGSFANDGGRSESLFFTTSNKCFVIKTLSNSDMKYFKRIAYHYAKRVVLNPQSLLVRILGVYKLNGKYFCIMENVVPDKKKSVVYDMKGSKANRKVETGRTFYGKTLKDVNFYENNETICLNDEERAKVLHELNEDIAFLDKLELMDYSLLIVKYLGDKDFMDNRYLVKGSKACYCFAIIDIFQEYDLKKQIERFAKKICAKKPDGISSLSANEYYKRFKGMLNDLFIG